MNIKIEIRNTNIISVTPSATPAEVGQPVPEKTIRVSTDLQKRVKIKPKGRKKVRRDLPQGHSKGTVEWVEGWIERRGYKYAYATDGFTFGKGTVSIGTVMGRMEIESNDNRTGIRIKDLWNAVRLWRENQKRLVLEACRKKLAFQRYGKENDDEAFIRAITGKVDEVDLTVLRHFIWQVK